MSTLSSNRRIRAPGSRGILAPLVSALGLVLLGLVCARVATSHYEKTVLELAIGLPLVALVSTAIYRRPSWGVIGIGAALVIVPSYAAPVKNHLVIHPALLLSLIAALVLMLRSIAGRKTRFSIIDVLVSLFVFGLLLSATIGPRPFKELTAQLWVWLLPYFGGRLIAANPGLNRTLAKTMVIGGVILTPFAVVEAAGGGNPFWQFGTGGPAQVWAHGDVRAGESFRVETSFGHPIAFSMFLAVAIVFALVLIGESRTRRERLLWTAAIACLLLDEVLTRSRSGIVALGVAVLLLAAGRRRSTVSQVARRAIAGGVAVVIALAVAFPSVASVPLSLAGLQSDQSDAALNQTAGYRTDLYSEAINGGVASLLGNKVSKLQGSIQTANASIDSEYLLLLDQWGVLATLAFLGIVVALVVRSLTGQEDEWATTYAACTAGLAVALASVALITQQEYFVWLMLGMSAAPRPLPNPFPGPPDAPAVGGRPGVRLTRARERTNLEVVVATLKRRWWILLVCPVIFGGIALEYSKHKPVRYTASSSLLFQVPNFGRILFGQTFDALSSNPVRAAATNLSLASLPEIAQGTAQRVPGISASRIQSETALSESGRSDMYLVNVTDQNPVLAARIANAYAREYVNEQIASDRSHIASVGQEIKRELAAMPSAQRNSAEAQALQQRSNELTLVSALQNGGAEISSFAHVPTSPSYPLNKKTAKYGAIIGLLFGFILLFWIARRDRRVRDAAAVEDAYGVPLLGSVSDEQAATLGAALLSRSAASAEAFHRVRATLRYYHLEREIRTLLVASAGAQEGRSTVALQLAIAEASSGRRVLLLEADLRRPTLAAALETAPTPGLTEFLSDETTYQQAIRTVSIGTVDDGSSAGTQIDLLPAGSRPVNPVELLEQDSMVALLDRVSDDYDLVVIDSPALSMVPDVMPLLGHVTGVVVAGRIGRTTRSSARTLREQLAQAGAPTLGVIATSVPTPRRRPAWLTRAQHVLPRRLARS